MKSESLVAQLWPTLCDPIDCSLRGFSVHGIFQARVLEWVAISFSRGSSRPRDWNPVSHTAGGHFILWATREALRCLYLSFSPLVFASLLFTAICKDSHFAFLHFFSMGMVLIPVSCTMLRTSVYSSSGTLSIRSYYLTINLSNGLLGKY